MEKPKLFQSMRAFKSMKDLAAPARDYPVKKQDYQLIEIIGRGVSATVWHAKCLPLDETVAVKILDMERMNVQLEEIMHEAQSMCLYHHPNVLTMHTAFVVGKDLWFVEPLITGGSVFNIMKFKYPNGLDELVIAIIMKEVAKALEYVHRSGGIHRDVKAGNILINTDGCVFLADFGVAATIERGGSWGSGTGARRNSFVGTPCWMAPEVMEQTEGYDSKADIWSFGITMLELAHGHAPFAKLPPMKVLLMTIQNEPPQLGAESECGQRQFSKHMRDLVAQCLQKDPTKRPTASQVLESKFFKGLPDTKYLVTHLVKSLPSLADRVKMLEQHAAATNEEDTRSVIMKSKEEYVRGVSGWNFGDIMAIKAGKDDVSYSPSIPESSQGSKIAAHPPTEARFMAGARQSDGWSSALSASRRNVEHVNALDAPRGSGHEKNGKQARLNSFKSPTKMKAWSLILQSRFLVTTENQGLKKTSLASEPSTISEGSYGMGHYRDSDSLFITPGEQPEFEHKSVQIGRFRVQDQVVKKEDGKGERERDRDRKATTSSTVSTGSSFIPPATVMSSQLQSYLSTQKTLCQSMERMVEALKEAEKGHPAALQTLMASSNSDSNEALMHRIKELESENKHLKERNAQLEQQLSTVSMSDWSRPSQESKRT